MMGIPIQGASFVYSDNMSVVTKVSKPELTLRKKSNTICYQAVCESVEMDKARVVHIPTQKNLANWFTNVMYVQNSKFLVSRMLWDVFFSK